MFTNVATNINYILFLFYSRSNPSFCFGIRAPVVTLSCGHKALPSTHHLRGREPSCYQQPHRGSMHLA